MKERLNRFTYQKHNSTYTPATLSLCTTMKLMYDLIHLVHHLSKVTTTVTNNTPHTFKRLTHLLNNTVKPAAPNTKVLQLLEGNVKSWSYMTAYFGGTL